jgi:peptidyl-prolyl cis-trans isomerase B (cyclophilin B)
VIDSVVNVERDQNDNPLDKVEMTVRIANKSEVLDN